MALDEDVLIKTKDEILSDMVTEWQSAVPDVWLGEDGVLRMLLELQSGQIEGLYLANQILREDMFIQTAGIQALELYGDMYGVPRKGGSQAVGQLKFSGNAGTYIPIGAEVAYDPGTGEENVLVFETAEDGTIPTPGSPTAPTVAVGAAGNLTGSFEYAVSFVTAEGETTIGAISAVVAPTADQVDLSSIPLGGAGTIARRIYRRAVGGEFKRVTAGNTLNDNTTTVYTDDTADISANPDPPATNTALSIQLDGIAEEAGVDFNVVSFSITELHDVPDGITGVTNLAAFAGGTDEEEGEAFRTRLLNTLRAPGSGSVLDIEAWAESVEGVDDATVFENDNLGTPTNGHTTIRISGPNGTQPPQSVIDAVQEYVDSKDMANITLHVAGFTAVSTDVTVTITVDSGFTLAEITPSVDQEIRDYINDLPAGGTFRRNELVAVLIPLPGVLDLTVDTPATDQVTAAGSKRTPGTITVQ